MGNKITDETILDEPDQLKEYDCSPCTKSTGFTKLMKWVLMIKKYPELKEKIKELLNKDKDKSILNKQNTKKWSALMLACRNSTTWSSETMVKLLIDLIIV